MDEVKMRPLIMVFVIVIGFLLAWSSPLKTEHLTAMINVSEANSSSNSKDLIVNKITDQSFVVTGITEKNAEVVITRNGEDFKTLTSNSGGSFTFRMPLQAVNTEFGFQVKTADGQIVATEMVIVQEKEKPERVILQAPIVKQLPELARGCEVTSLTMLLNYAGVEADKMLLALEVERDPAKKKVIGGKTYFGNPNNGFVGDMYSFHKPGFGVFHGPIEELANKYMHSRIVNLTGRSFDSVLHYVAAGHPVWVITTSTFDHVPKNEWETWYTDEGPIEVTSRMHSVLVTGYDSQYIYFNDPLDGQINKKIPKENFIKGWTQYGSQAISYY
jgi:uncharacterized protein YvpB